MFTFFKLVGLVHASNVCCLRFAVVLHPVLGKNSPGLCAFFLMVAFRFRLEWTQINLNRSFRWFILAGVLAEILGLFRIKFHLEGKFLIKSLFNLDQLFIEIENYHRSLSTTCFRVIDFQKTFIFDFVKSVFLKNLEFWKLQIHVISKTILYIVTLSSFFILQFFHEILVLKYFLPQELAPII